MESIDDNFSKGEIRVTGEALENLRLTARWATFLAIVGFIGLGLMLLGAFAMFSMSSSRNSFSRYSGNDFDGSVLAIIYLVMAVIYFFPIYYMYQFAMKMKKAIDEKDSMSFTESTGFLRNQYQFIGVITIIILSLYILLIVVGIGGSLM